VAASVWQLWGKSGNEGVHPLLCHMIDVAEVSQAMWQRSLGGGFRGSLAGSWGLTEKQAGRLIAFLTALHDLGKASPEFQRQDDAAAQALRSAGLEFPTQIDPTLRAYHGVITAKVLPHMLEQVLGLPRKAARGLATAVGGHHGSWPLPAEKEDLKHWHLGGADWDVLREEIVFHMASLYQPLAPSTLWDEPECTNSSLALISGLTSIADWIASMESNFPYEPNAVDEHAYRETAQKRAQQALRELGWTHWRAPTATLSFRDLVGLEPRPLQETAETLSGQLEEPSLVLIEAPTGQGKTEAAYQIADGLMARFKLRGLYVAMPTMATSNQMHERMCRLLESRYPGVGKEALLLHSRARWQRGAEKLRPRLSQKGSNDAEEETQAMAWFFPRKRGLLAPLAVGTVDQAFLSVLQTRHFFVRLFGLARKVVVFDEVHAYDTYMSEIFKRLLSWLGALGSPVVILSATLPAVTRSELLAAYAGESVDLPEVHYPTITWWSGGLAMRVPLEQPEERRIAVEWIKDDAQELAEVLKERLAEECLPDAQGHGSHRRRVPVALSRSVPLLLAPADRAAGAGCLRQARRPAGESDPSGHSGDRAEPGPGLRLDGELSGTCRSGAATGR